MTHRYAQLTSTGSVIAAQQRYGTRETNAQREARGGEARLNGELGARETEFIAARNSFYMATVGDNGWPYVQHRGGPAGFLKVLGPNTLGFADFRGNLQFLSVGHIDHDDRVSLILVDYPARRRLKILGHARIVDGDRPDILAKVLDADYDAIVERAVLIEVEAYDWNCSQHITPRYAEAELEARLRPLKQRIAALETQLRGQCGAST